MSVRWGVFEADKSDDGLTHIAPVDRKTLTVSHPHELAEHCVCRPRVAGGMVVHDTIGDTVLRLLTRKALLPS